MLSHLDGVESLPTQEDELWEIPGQAIVPSQPQCSFGVEISAVHPDRQEYLPGYRWDFYMQLASASGKYFIIHTRTKNMKCVHILRYLVLCVLAHMQMHGFNQISMAIIWQI